MLNQLRNYVVLVPTILSVQTSARSITEFNPLTGQTQPPDATNSTPRGWTDVGPC